MVIFLGYDAAVLVCGCLLSGFSESFHGSGFFFVQGIAAPIGIFLLGIFSIFTFAHDRVMDIFVVRGNAPISSSTPRVRECASPAPVLVYAKAPEEGGAALLSG